MKTNRIHLEEISLRNFATFEQQTVNFDTGFNAIIGETGSGKSLILQALQLVLGHRADKKIVRKGCEYSVIEAIFSCNDNKIKTYLEEIGYPCEEDAIIVKRLIYSNGRSKAYINDLSCTLTTLVSFTHEFVDLVGQFENQKLLQREYQLSLLDDYGQHHELTKSYSQMYQKYLEASKALSEAQTNQHLREQKIDFLKFQLSEIEELDPSLEDEKKCIDTKNFILNHEKRQQVLSLANNIMTEGDNGNLLQLSNRLKETVQANSDFFSDDLNKRIREMVIEIEDISYEMTNQNHNEGYLEEDVDLVIERLDTYQKLKRKYNGTVEGILDFQEKASSELLELTNFQEHHEKLQSDVALFANQASSIATKLHNMRLATAEKLSSELSQTIQKLRMQGATIRIDLEKSEDLSTSGYTQIQLMAETNKGEGFYQVKNIASGGELSRILLAMRQILSSNDSISIFLFDEIDTGIGGETALTIGETMSEVARSSQVIAITHLPQIATFASKLVVVSKEFQNNRTVTSVREVTGEDSKAVVKEMAPVT